MEHSSPEHDGRAAEAFVPAAGRVAGLTSGVIAVSLVATVLVTPGMHALAPMPGVGFWTLAVAFAVAEALPVHFEHRREAMSITLTNVPLVVGLYAVAPVTVLAAHLVGTAVALATCRHQKPLKLTTNLASFWVQTIVCIVVFRSLTLGSVEPNAWPGVLVAVVAGDAAQTVVLASAICVYQRSWEGSLRDSAAVSSVAAIVETSVGLVAVSLLLSQPAALLPLGVVTALVLLSLRTHRSLGERHRELGQILEFTSAMGDAQLDGRVLTTLLNRVRDVMHAERASLYLDDGEGGLLATSTASLTGELVRAGSEALVLHHAAHAAAQPIVVGAADTLHRDLLQAAGAVDMLIAPLAGSSGVVGTLVVADRSGQVRGFGIDDARLFATLANHASVSLENDRLIERLREKARESEHHSLHDALTGLPNRVLFARRLADALAGGSSAAVLLLDLDRFKEVNDTLGHHNGDLLLQQVGQRLRETLRTGDVIARLGGDEFAVLLPDIHAEQAALQVGRGIIELLEQPFTIGDMSVDVGASIGIAVAPRDGADPVVLVQRADVAMYTAKSDQTGVEMYRPERDGYSPERLMLVGELKHAVQQGELDVHYQPQVDLSDGTVIGMEALVRWNHATRGPVRPDEFVPVAEHAGLIRPLTLFVLGRALAASSRWRAAGQPVRVSVNLSARSILQPTLVEDVAALLRRHDIAEGGLCLEVTESSIMADPRRTAMTLEALRDLGVIISIDDFGTGHSSLAYIKRLPVSEIKIDKAFVLSMLADHSDDTIVGAVVNLGRNLGISVVAEGVENERTRARLRDIGCPVAQGYFFARPMPGSDVLAWLADQSPVRRDCVVVPLGRPRDTAHAG